MSTIHPRLCGLAPLQTRFANNKTVIGLITDSEETANRRAVNNLTQWCQENNINVDMTKKMTSGGVGQGWTPFSINRSAVVSSFKFISVHITEDLTWDEQTGHMVEKKHNNASSTTDS